MKLNRIFKVILGIIIVSPLLVLVLLILALVWPTTPLPIEDVFLGACSSDYDSEYAVGKRPHSFSMFPQGSWYDESGEVTVSKEAASNIYNQLAENSEFKLSNGHFEKIIVGKVLAHCTVDLESGQIKYKYVLW
jgi:hypothetical protein